MAESAGTIIRTAETPVGLRCGLVSGFVAFGSDLGTSYALRGRACSIGAMTLLHIISGICLLIVVSGLVTTWLVLRDLPEEKNEEGGEPHDRAHFQALLGIAFNLAFILVIFANAIPRWMLHVCD